MKSYRASDREQELKEQLRNTPLIERLEQSRGMIVKMCSEGRPPKMTIPVQWGDEDFFIIVTIKDAMRAVEIVGQMEAALAELGGPGYFEEWKKQNIVADSKGVVDRCAAPADFDCHGTRCSSDACEFYE